MDLVLSYLVIVLSEIWHKGVLVAVGTPLEVTRAERAAMLPATARDATAEEIEKYRGGAAQGGIDAASALSTVQTELDSLEGRHAALLEEVETLELKKEIVAGEIEALGGSKGQLVTEVEELASKKQDLALDVAALEKAKEAAKAPAKAAK
jgi:chromosome segregation ATPase